MKAPCHPDRDLLCKGLCSRCYAKKRYAEKTETIKAQVNAYRGRNPDRVAASQKKYHEANKDKRVAQHKEWLSLNRERVRVLSRRSAHKHAEKNRLRKAEYKRQNRAKCAEHWRRRNAALKGAMHFGPIPVAVLQARADVYGDCCAYCGTPEWQHWDHVIPISREGMHIPANLRPACATCNCSKGAKKPQEWLRAS